MQENFEINFNQIDKIDKISKEEREFRIKNLERFHAVGFPNKRLEDWKFSDFKEIIGKNFDKLDVEKISPNINKIDLTISEHIFFVSSSLICFGKKLDNMLNSFCSISSKSCLLFFL